MRVVIQTFGSAGDVHPFVGLGRTLSARGHAVAVLANEVFGELVQHAGLDWLPCGDAEAYHRCLDDPDLWHRQKGLAVVVHAGVVPQLRPAYELLVEQLDSAGDTVLVTSDWGLSARLVSETHGTPLVMTHLQPMGFRSVHRAPRFPGLTLPDGMPAFLKRAAYRLMDIVVDRELAPPLNALRRTLGLPPVKRVFDAWIQRSDLLLGLFPDWFGPPQPDWPKAVLTGFPLWDGGEDRELDPALAAWVREGDPPLVFTPGSANTFGADFFAASIEAAELLGRRALLTTAFPDRLPAPLPPSVRHASFPPFSRLLPHAAAVVHHGGVGTTSQTLAAGRPALVCPLAFDQFDNGSRLVDLGVGAVLPMVRFTAKRAAPLLERLLRDERGLATCRDLAARLSAQDGLAAAAEAIERTAVGARR